MSTTEPTYYYVGGHCHGKPALVLESPGNRSIWAVTCVEHDTAALVTRNGRKVQIWCLEGEEAADLGQALLQLHGQLISDRIRANVEAARAKP